MTALTVVGGLYREVCLEPSGHRELFGSGGRAAWTARQLGSTVDLQTCVDDITESDMLQWAADTGIIVMPVHVPRVPAFHYRHPLSRPLILPAPAELTKPIEFSVENDVVLRFGMLEASAVVRAETVVYDPQSAFTPESFSANGSRATHLAVVANDYEARTLVGDARCPLQDLVIALRKCEGADVAVLKAGPFGTWIATADECRHMPCLITDRVWSLGSGDVFASVFAVRWGVDGIAPFEAVEDAVRVVARYADTGSVPLREEIVDLTGYPALEAPSSLASSQVYLAAPFFTMAHRWLVDEIRNAVPGDIRVFSPLHDVGRGPYEEVAPADLEGLRQSQVVLAVADGDDPGTLVEIGYARARGIRVVVLAETIAEEHLVMLRGSGCVITRDLCSAIYHTVWQACTAMRELETASEA